MQELLIAIGTILGCLISGMTIVKFNFYTKEEVDNKEMVLKGEFHEKFEAIKKESDDRDKVIETKLEANHTSIVKELVETKESIYEKLLEAERLTNKQAQEIYDRLNQNKQIFDDYNRNMLEAISQLKADEKEITANMIQVVNNVKDEIKKDYTTRYNELLQMMGSKTNVEDFNRLEAKFDKISESIAELKTIVRMTLNDDKKQR